MHRSSECVAALATALAKAQMELTNPEKSMIGTISHHNRGAHPLTFRYAPLSGGLEIIRKTLGGQQIAIAQSTAIDHVNKIVNLTTTLMHTSGEWISSEWPVCQLSETSAPRRMGAALTYARRYALFTLVGIAGDDDLDAPESQNNNTVASQSEAARAPIQSPTNQPPFAYIQNTAEAGLLLGQLQSEIASQTSIEDLQVRAPAILKAKNSLSTENAKAIEEAFAAKLASLQPTSTTNSKPDPANGGRSKRTQSSLRKAKTGKPTPVPKRPKQLNGKARDKLNGHVATPPTTPIESNADVADVPPLTAPLKIEKSELAIGEPRRHRNKNHLRFVASQPCLICGRSPSDAHHLRFVQPRAMGRKTSDEFTVPLCRTHHRDNHRFGDEKRWWTNSAIDPVEVSQKLWRSSRGTSTPITVDNRLNLE